MCCQLPQKLPSNLFCHPPTLTHMCRCWANGVEWLLATTIKLPLSGSANHNELICLFNMTVIWSYWNINSTNEYFRNVTFTLYSLSTHYPASSENTHSPSNWFPWNFGRLHCYVMLPFYKVESGQTKLDKLGKQKVDRSGNKLPTGSHHKSWKL